MSEQQHINVLDGLRGFAVLYVMIDHLFPYHSFSADTIISKSFFALLSMGWSGVDLFFVLSGFLITGILLKSKESSSYYMTFYGRRVLRIFPLYFALLILFILIIPRISLFGPNYFWISEGTVWQYWFFFVNMGVVSDMAAHKFLSVAWSLSIEEQYYLLWPSVVRWLTPNRILITCITGLILSFFLRIILYFYFSQSPSNLYHLSFTHLDGILLGSLLSVLYSNKDRYGKILLGYSKLVPLAGLGCLIITIWSAFYPSDSQHICYQLPMVFFGYTLLPLFYGSVLITCLYKRNAIYRLFNLSFLRKCGKYSYCMYLIHLIVAWAVVLFFRKMPREIFVGESVYNLAIFSMTFIITYLASYLSWKFFEGPFNSMKQYFSYDKSNNLKKIGQYVKM